MQLRLEQLEAHLLKALAPVYAVHGDEPLLALEAADALRGAARSRGFTDREVLEPGRSFDWSEFTHAAASLSLFAGKKLVELRLPTGKPGTQGAAALAGYLARPSADVLLLVSLPRLDRAGQRSDWFGALSAAGVVVDIYPVERARLPAWIAARLARHAVQQAVASVARYDPYAAAEALVSSELARYVRVIEGLRGEGEQPTFVLFVISAALFVLHGLQRGAAADPLFVQHRLFNRPLQRAVQAAAKHFQAAALERALSQAAAIDRAIKGVGSGDPWQGFIT